MSTYGGCDDIVGNCYGCLEESEDGTESGRVITISNRKAIASLLIESNKKFLIVS